MVKRVNKIYSVSSHRHSTMNKRQEEALEKIGHLFNRPNKDERGGYALRRLAEMVDETESLYGR